MIKSVFFFLNNIPTSCLHHPGVILIYSDCLRTSKVLGAASINFDLQLFILVISWRYLGWLTESFKHLFSFSKASLEFPCWSSWNQGLAEKIHQSRSKECLIYMKCVSTMCWKTASPNDVFTSICGLVFFRFIPAQNTVCRMSLILASSDIIMY